MKPNLSIIMPVYNTAKFLHRSIDSILAQSFTDWELILIDDGSKDNSGKLCDEYALSDFRIKVIHKENGGAGSARNAGLDVAQGKYVVFPDSDDWIDKEAYEFCVNMMDNHHLDMLLFGSINTVYDEDDTVYEEKKGKIFPCHYKTQYGCRKHFAELMDTQPMRGPSDKVYRMSIIRENKIRFPDLRRMQDGVFNMLYYDCISSFEVVDKFFYHFTMHSSDYQMKKIPKDFIDCAITFHKTAIGLLEKWNEKSEDNERIMGNWFTDVVIIAQTDYLPREENTRFSDVYRHIRFINNHTYVHDFYLRFSKIHKMRKIEIAIKHRMNLVLALSAVRTIH